MVEYVVKRIHYCYGMWGYRLAIARICTVKLVYSLLLCDIYYYGQLLGLSNQCKLVYDSEQITASARRAVYVLERESNCCFFSKRIHVPGEDSEKLIRDSVIQGSAHTGRQWSGLTTTQPF